MNDILVIGAGPVGATFAALARSRGQSVQLLEARPGRATEQRTLALSHGSRLILEAVGAWQDSLAATEIHRIHSSQRGGFGRTVIDRSDARVPALGYVLSYAQLQAALDAAMAQRAIPVQRGAVVTDIAQRDDCVEVYYSQDGAICTARAAVLVLADGGANLAKVPALKTTEKDYHQVAMLGHVTCATAHRNIAYERFTPDGPCALLPHGGSNEFSMVWVSNPDAIAALMAMDESACCAAFQAHFGDRAGRLLTVSARKSFPLKLRTIDPRVVGRIAVIGNAAQALHPVAGQGFNLGLRDASTLSECLSNDAHTADTALRAYADARSGDVERSVGFTDFLVSAFASDNLALRATRGLGLLAVDVLPIARRALARRMLFGASR